MATSVRKAPRIAENGLPGDRARIRLELRLVVDVAIVGLPNAGKSSLLRAVSAARPKVASYPFTTREPQVGVVQAGYEARKIVEIPAVLTNRQVSSREDRTFLRHALRAWVLAVMVDVSGEDPERDMGLVRDELGGFGQGLEEKPWVVVLNKVDISGAADRAAVLKDTLGGNGIKACSISARTGDGVEELITVLLEEVHREEQKERPEEDQNVPLAEPDAIEVKRTGKGFRVSGGRAATAIAKIGLETQEARAEVARRLGRMGVTAALRRAGAKPGDRVRIGRSEVDWLL